MITSESLHEMRTKIRERAESDRNILETLRKEVQPLREAIRRIRPRSVTSVAIVAADGGNNQVSFDPYLFQIVRVVDSYGEELLVDVISPTTDPKELMTHHFNKHGEPHSALGVLMKDLDIETLWELSPMIPHPRTAQPKPSWVQVYRELSEWAALYQLLKRDFSTDTLIVFDGLLRSKVFTGELFLQFRKLVAQTFEEIWAKNKRRIYLVGVAKKSKVLQRYRLAFALEGILTQEFPCYVEVPRKLEEKAYVWPEYAKGDEDEGEAPKFVAGAMFMVKFGDRPSDPIWPVDVFLPQREQASEILSYLLADSVDGFPIPLYPRCLQRAHEQAALAGFEMDLLEDLIYQEIRASMREKEQEAVDRVRLQEDVSGRRYG
jgi:hypothetical protein